MSDSLRSCWSAFPTWEKEIASLGKPGITLRSTWYGQATPVDLMARYREVHSRSEATRATIMDLMSEVSNLGQEMSEIMLFLSFHRVFDPERAPAVGQSSQVLGDNRRDIENEPVVESTDANG